MSKRFIAIFLILCFLTVTFFPENTTAETVYLGGSNNIGSGVGTGGKHSIVLPPEFPMALRLSIQIQKPGDFAEQGYENSYPVSEYSLVLVPPGTPDIAKHRNVLASKGNGKCEYVSDHPAVILGDEGDAREAIWNLFVGGSSGVYKGDATALIGDGRTADYTSFVTTELFTNQAGIPLGTALLAAGQMYVSTQEIPKDDDVKQVQMALAGVTLGQALKSLGQNLNLEDMANYFLGKVSKNEYIVIIENMLACKDTANPDLGYWWTLPNTAISEISGHDVLPEEYSGTTGAPKASEDRNLASSYYGTKLFLYKEGIKIPLNQVNGYYDFVDVAEEQYISFSEAEKNLDSDVIERLSARHSYKMS